MKPFVYDPTVTTPLDVARRDYMELFVETIIDHRGNVKRKKEFLVSWLGYDDRDNSWNHIPVYVTLERQPISAKFL
jgi:Chromo (CHRromatin Organisation MOdifier) domain